MYFLLCHTYLSHIFPTRHHKKFKVSLGTNLKIPSQSWGRYMTEEEGLLSNCQLLNVEVMMEFESNHSTTISSGNNHQWMLE